MFKKSINTSCLSCIAMYFCTYIPICLSIVQSNLSHKSCKVYLCTYLTVHLSFKPVYPTDLSKLSIYKFNFLSILQTTRFHLSSYPSIYLSIYLSPCLSIYLCFFLPICQIICIDQIYLSICLRLDLYTYLHKTIISIHLSFCLSIYCSD